MIPKQPFVLAGWRRVGSLDVPGEEIHVFTDGRFQVLSGYGEMEFRGLTVPHFHVSAAVLGKKDRRLTDAEMGFVRKDFDMEDAEEDNHSPGVARHLFRPVHLPKGTVGLCDCKENEEIVTEPDGYQWTRPKQGAS